MSVIDEQTQLLREIRDAVQEHRKLYDERTGGILEAQQKSQAGALESQNKTLALQAELANVERQVVLWHKIHAGMLAAVLLVLGYLVVSGNLTLVNVPLLSR